MNENKEEILADIEARAEQEAEYLAGEFARSAARDREAILAGLEFERELLGWCQLARQPHPK